MRKPSQDKHRIKSNQSIFPNIIIHQTDLPTIFHDVSHLESSPAKVEAVGSWTSLDHRCAIDGRMFGKLHHWLSNSGIQEVKKSGSQEFVHDQWSHAFLHHSFCWQHRDADNAVYLILSRSELGVEVERAQMRQLTRWQKDHLTDGWWIRFEYLSLSRSELRELFFDFGNDQTTFWIMESSHRISNESKLQSDIGKKRNPVEMGIKVCPAVKGKTRQAQKKSLAISKNESADSPSNRGRRSETHCSWVPHTRFPRTRRAYLLSRHCCWLWTGLSFS
jgi:hypothetical protein